MCVYVCVCMCVCVHVCVRVQVYVRAHATVVFDFCQASVLGRQRRQMRTQTKHSVTIQGPATCIRTRVAALEGGQAAPVLKRGASHPICQPMALLHR